MTRLGWPDQNTRRRLVEEAATRLGGKAALGRKLGYQDGAYVGQMIRGDRVVSERTLTNLARWPELRDLFEPFLLNRAPEAREETGASYSVNQSTAIARALETLSLALAAAAPDTREALAANLAGWARSGGREPWSSLVASMLDAPTDKLVAARR